jgi:hypothetical protein
MTFLVMGTSDYSIGPRLLLLVLSLQTWRLALAQKGGKSTHYVVNRVSPAD